MQSVYIGLDIGGTKFMVAAADAELRISKIERASTPVGLQDGLELLHTMITQVAGDAQIAGIGAAIGGPLNWETGVVSPVHQPEWRNVPLRELMVGRWRCPFAVDVDTNIAALGEYVLGNYQVPRLLYLTLSTGMGGGLIVDGTIYRGRDGSHPEAGHQAIPYRCAHPEHIACDCGSPDCLEALISGNGIRRIYGKPADELDAAEWDEVAYNLGQGLRNLATLYAPDVIVLGGGIAHGQGERLLAPARELMASRLRIVPAPAVQLSRLGYDTALMGALVAARQGLRVEHIV